MTILSVEVPQGLEDRFMQEAQRILDKISQEAKRNDELQLIMLDDKAMLDYLDRACCHTVSHHPVVRATTYKNQIQPRQEIIRGHLDFRNDERRPVLMRGSIECMSEIYQQKSAMADKIADRYLRMTKFTAFTQEQTEEMMHWLSRRLDQNGWYVHDSWSLVEMVGRKYGDDETCVWKAGQYVPIPNKEYLDILKTINAREYNIEVKRQKELKAKKKYVEYLEAQTEAGKKRKAAAAQKQRERDNERRQRRAAEIAAYELLSEIGAAR